MTSFIEQQFPTDISYGSRGGPGFSTAIVTSKNGQEKRNINWSQARARYDVSYGIRSQTQLDSLLAFFNACQGRARGFRYKDWTDYSLTGQVIDTGTGLQTAFQIIKTYTLGSTTFTRTITKPIASTLSVYVDGVLQVSGYTLDSATGIITFDAAPDLDDPISVTCEFDVPVRFDMDQLEISLDDINEQTAQNVTLTEIRI